MANCRPVPYLLFGPAGKCLVAYILEFNSSSFFKGTGKTSTIVEAIEHIIRTTNQHILVCANSNTACDEVAERIVKVLGQSSVFRLYAKSFNKTLLKPQLQQISNLQNGEFQFPPLEHLHKFRVLVCTLLTAGLLVRANGIDAKHFSHIIIKGHITPSYYFPITFRLVSYYMAITLLLDPNVIRLTFENNGMLKRLSHVV